MSDFDTPSRRIFSVSELNNETKQLLEQRFFSVFVRGEVSNISAPRSGHWYFTLKDETAQIRAVMFKQANFKHRLPALGDELIVGGQLSFYRERGEVQIIANQIRPAGLGDLQQQFEQLKKKLLDEGLFEKSQKTPIPALPRKLAIITSATGAVIQDITQICARRASSLPLLLIPVRVQGSEAEKEICDALEICSSRNDIDLILLARGGGSLEDLAAFNSESVARALFNSRLPVISAVGHETDTSIADFVADLRAATPSEAAELATSGYQEFRKQLRQSESSLKSILDSHVISLQNQLDKLGLKLKSPADEVRQTSQKLDYMEARLTKNINQSVAQQQQYLTRLEKFLDPKRLHTQVSNADNQLSQLLRRLRRETNAKKEQCADKLSKALVVLEAINPLNTMTRGYSVTFDSNGNIIQSIQQVSEGHILNVRLSDGVLESSVEKITRNSET